MSDRGIPGAAHPLPRPMFDQACTGTECDAVLGSPSPGVVVAATRCRQGETSLRGRTNDSSANLLDFTGSLHQRSHRNYDQVRSEGQGFSYWPLHGCVVDANGRHFLENVRSNPRKQFARVELACVEWDREKNHCGLDVGTRWEEATPKTTACYRVSPAIGRTWFGSTFEGLIEFVATSLRILSVSTDILAFM